MADVQSAAQWIGRLLVEEAKYLAQVGVKVKELQDELEWMQCFLRGADASQLDNSMARKWVAQIRELAYEAEDTIEKFIVNNRGGGNNFKGMFRRYSRVLWKVVALHKIGHDIDQLKRKMSLLTSRLSTYGINLRLEDSSASWLSKTKHESYFCLKEEKLVGREEDVYCLLKTLVEMDGVDAQVASGKPSSSNMAQPSSLEAKTESRVFGICGVAGVGKTCVAKVIFHHPKVRRCYEAFAWASISRPCQFSAIQQQLLGSLTSKSREQIAQMTDGEMKNELRKVQQKRKCFIVLDGVWSKEVWDHLQEAFPMTFHEFKSKLLVTTRDKDVARHVHQCAEIHDLQCLNPDQSMLLLEDRIKGALTGLSADENEEVDRLKKTMLNHCVHLPLAVVVLGGVLATKRTLKEWRTVGENISSYSIDKSEQQWKRILELAYYDLPFQIKPCFLYLGYFPTNLEITTTKLARLWEAEGLVSTSDNDDSEETLEDIAESCLAELVERSLVQVGSRDVAGRAKTCRLHDVMQQLCMNKALKVNWLSVVELGVERDQSSDASSKPSKSSRAANRKSRRLAVYCREKLEKLPSDYRHSSYVRSLLFFNTLEREDILIPLKKKALESTFNRYKLLRVLDVENIGVASLPKNIGNLIHLRYLSLRGSWVSKLPRSIKSLRCLQTLDLRVLTFVSVRIPDVLWSLEWLVHLYLPPKPFFLQGKAERLQLTDLVHLETLANFSNKCKADDVGTLANLRDFSSCEYISAKESIDPLLGLSSPTLLHLEHISLRLGGQYLSNHPNALSGCNSLHKLWVRGEITGSVYRGMFPENLIQLTLIGTKFFNDPMPVLGRLPKLKKLSLEHASYEGTTMCCPGEGFPKLSNLTLRGLKNLEDWTVEEKAMPVLFSLEINRCQNLKMLPEGLKYVKKLQELNILYMPLISFFKGWNPVKPCEKWCDFDKVKHVPFWDISKVLDLQQTQTN